MSVLGSIKFNRTLKQFLGCKELASDKGVKLTEKLHNSARDSLERLIQIIPDTPKPHSEVLKKICLEHVEGSTVELFLKNLDADVTDIRSTTASILSRSVQISPSKLFRKLHESDVSKTEVIDILAFRRKHLKPDEVISNALKLEKSYAERLLKLAQDSELPLDLNALKFAPAAIKSPSIKIWLLHYLAAVEQPEVAQVIARFLVDQDKTVVIEALKLLKNFKGKFDASVLLPSIETMSEVERDMALDVVSNQADVGTVYKLAPWACGKSDEIREKYIKLFVKHVTTEGLENFLGLLEAQEWYGRDQALKCMQKFGSDGLLSAARGLGDHTNDFIRDASQQFAAQSSDPADLKQLWGNALHENWQVRESAIETVGKSGKRESLSLLKKVIEKWPDSTPSVLKAVSDLGFSKGLEIGFKCLQMREARVQREALETIGKLATKQHAKPIRDILVKAVPTLQAIVRDTAGQVINRLTEEFELPALNIDRETYFDTRLFRSADSQSADQAVPESAQFASIEDLKKGDLWMDRYRIDREIGRGAMGRVMLAKDEMVGESLILKFMHPESTAEEESRERFLREVRYSRKISHPNVIRIHDMLFKDSLTAISMEYFESKGIDEYRREQKYFEPMQGLVILMQVAYGMAAAHKQDVIHRDLKPSNILMNDKGLVKIVDFGIALASTNAESTLTEVGAIIGTPAYLSPERVQGKDADHRSDIYALGIIAYAMFCGQLPYVGEPMSMLFQHIEGKAIPAHEIRKEVSPHISLLVQKMMAVKLNDRLQTMKDVVDAIKEVMDKTK